MFERVSSVQEPQYIIEMFIDLLACILAKPDCFQYSIAGLGNLPQCNACCKFCSALNYYQVTGYDNIYFEDAQPIRSSIIL